MNTLRQALNEYLALRQAMGFKLQEESRLLPRFIDFLDAHAAVAFQHPAGTSALCTKA